MFRRVILENWMSIFPLVAFVTAACVYGLISLKAIRMRSDQIERFGNLPFDVQENARHETKA